MAADQHGVRLMRGGLSRRIFAVTKWRDLGDGRIEAIEKHDVTDDFDRLVDEEDEPHGAG